MMISQRQEERGKKKKYRFDGEPRKLTIFSSIIIGLKNKKKRESFCAA